MSAGIVRDEVDACLTVALIGGGAIGSTVAQQLLESPESAKWRVLVVDPDVLEQKNLANSDLYRAALEAGAASCGVHKADALCALAARCGRTSWEARRAEIADVGWKELHACDVLVSCTDSALARVETAVISRRLGIPMLDTGTQPEGGEARMSWFSADAGASCFLCGLRPHRRAEILAYALSSAGSCAPLMWNAEMGSYPDAPAMLKALAACVLETLQRFACAKNGEARTRFGHSWSWHLRAGMPAEARSLPLGFGCPLHEAAAVELLPLEEDRPLGQQLPGPAWLAEFPWPISLRSRCLVCAAQSSTPVRLATLRGLACGNCGRPYALESLGTLLHVRADSAAAGLTPRQLGLPRFHALPLRRRIERRSRAFTGAGRGSM